MEPLLKYMDDHDLSKKVLYNGNKQQRDQHTLIKKIFLNKKD
jgi:hypothetical protein